jgi:hypothetical protein
MQAGKIVDVLILLMLATIGPTNTPTTATAAPQPEKQTASAIGLR